MTQFPSLDVILAEHEGATTRARGGGRWKGDVVHVRKSLKPATCPVGPEMAYWVWAGGIGGEGWGAELHETTAEIMRIYHAELSGREWQPED